MAAALLVCAQSATPQPASAQGQPGSWPGAPPEVLAALPEAATPAPSLPADLNGDGEPEWLVPYSTPSAIAASNAALAIIARLPTGWEVAKTLAIEGGALGSFWLVEVDGRLAVALQAVIGPHAVALEVARWDGREYRTVFAGASNAPAIEVADVNRDGLPEVLVGWSAYCEAYAVSPWLTTVHGWNGVRFEEATAAYPEVVAADQRAVLAVARSAVDWSARGRACLAGAAGYLAHLLGDPAGAAEQCARARALDAAWDEPWTDRFCPSQPASGLAQDVQSG